MTSIDAGSAEVPPSTEAGLTTAQAEQRLAEDGPNALPGGERHTLLSIALETMREPMSCCCWPRARSTSCSATCRKA